MLHERRTQELLADFRGPWTQTLDGCVAWCSFRRGFIEERCGEMIDRCDRTATTIGGDGAAYTEVHIR